MKKLAICMVVGVLSSTAFAEDQMPPTVPAPNTGIPEPGTGMPGPGFNPQQQVIQGQDASGQTQETVVDSGGNLKIIQETPQTQNTFGIPPGSPGVQSPQEDTTAAGSSNNTTDNKEKDDEEEKAPPGP